MSTVQDVLVVLMTALLTLGGKMESTLMYVFSLQENNEEMLQV